MKPRVGDWVEVRSKEEILETLDKNGRLEGLPFMPQMFAYCGRKFRVFKRAHKTCDWVHTVKDRQLPDGIHLDLRCDGEAYGGCQTACLIYWKLAWLKRVPRSREGRLRASPKARDAAAATMCTESDVWSGTRVPDEPSRDGTRYVCQATQLLEFTNPISRWNVIQYLEDWTSGNVTLGRLLEGFAYWLARRRRLGLPLRWIRGQFPAIGGNVPIPMKVGTIPAGRPTPASVLDLRPGELVRVKSFEEILATLDTEGKNRGLAFDVEMVPYCGGVFRVRSRLTKFIDEKTGRLSTMKRGCILLEGVTCQSRFSKCRMFCPRSIYSWWHEVWLERIPEPVVGGTAAAGSSVERGTTSSPLR
jgi:hypothetical protein